jgi:hypothetical protein
MKKKRLMEFYFGDLTERTHDPRTSKAVMKSFKCKGNIQKE